MFGGSPRRCSIKNKKPLGHHIAVDLLLEPHGSWGYFPLHIRMRKVAGAAPSRYEVARS